MILLGWICRVGGSPGRWEPMYVSAVGPAASAMIIYTNNLPSDHKAVTNGPIIRIRPSHKDDKGLLAHELFHVKQWWLTLGLHSFLYLFSKQYKLWSEVKAYKEQLKHYSDDRTELFAYFIATKYKLDITKDEAQKLLNK